MKVALVDLELQESQALELVKELEVEELEALGLGSEALASEELGLVLEGQV